MMSVTQLDKLLAIAAAAGVSELCVKQGACSVRMKLALVGPAVPTHTAIVSVRTPALGRFTSKHPRRQHSVVTVGQKFEAGNVLGFLALDALLLPVVAAHAGTVVSLEARDGDQVGYGQTVLTLAVGDTL